MHDQPTARLCECGCGQPTPLATRDRPERGQAKGQPTRCISGHHLRRRQGPDYEVDAATGCWLWRHGKTTAGYGSLRHKGRVVYAHVIYYERHKGPVPPGKELDHLCRNRACCNPGHLEPVSHRENMTRSPVTSKLNEVQVADLVRLHHAGWTRAELAEAFGITPGHVYKLRVKYDRSAQA